MRHDTTQAERHLKRIQAYINRMPSLSTTVAKVLQTCNNPKASANDLNRVISLDPVLAARVLKLINSAYYSLRQPVSSLSRAVIMLGVNTVKNLALSVAILENFRDKTSFQTFSGDDYWAHCICVGVTAKSLAALKGIPRTEHEEFFVAGLLHDLGKIPLSRQYPNHYASASDLARFNQEPLHLSEARVFGIDHCVVGQLIAKKWRLSRSLVEALSQHHHPEKMSEERQALISTLALANIYAYQIKVGFAGDIASQNIKIEPLLEQADLDRTSLDSLNDIVSDQVEKAKIFLEITQKS